MTRNPQGFFSQFFHFSQRLRIIDMVGPLKQIKNIDALKSYISSKIVLMSDSNGVFDEKDFIRTLKEIMDFVPLIEDDIFDAWDEARGAGV